MMVFKLTEGNPWEFANLAAVAYLIKDGGFSGAKVRRVTRKPPATFGNASSNGVALTRA